MLRILAIADRPPQRPIAETLAARSIDAIITLGDLGLAELRGLDAVTHIPKMGVYGNHCSGTYFPQLGITNLHRTTVMYRGVTFGGFEGSVRYKQSPYSKMYSQEEADALLADAPRVDVLCVHCPPYGINDEPDDLAHQGFRALRMYCENQRPKYLLHGHTYPTEQQLVRRYQDTEIIYVFSDRVLELDLP
ncbi:metallophosphoesterase [Candidatus Uhrbacteria bacterium]|nr:metallophosphoesterase [Candidatus Uhrbacteria bacterium]